MLRRSKSDRKNHGAPVLVVGDETDVVELIARILESGGWPATRTFSHDEAVENLLEASSNLSSAEPFAAVVCDFTSGGSSSSLKLLDLIRHDDALENTAVVILTSTLSNRSYAWQSGADGFLVRPFHGNELIDAVGTAIGRTPEERRIYRQQQAQIA